MRQPERIEDEIAEGVADAAVRHYLEHTTRHAEPRVVVAPDFAWPCQLWKVAESGREVLECTVPAVRRADLTLPAGRVREQMPDAHFPGG